MCLLAKNEHRHIREWIVHHYSIGVRRFYVFDDNSSPPMQALLQDFINLGLVDYELLLETLKPKDQSIYQYHMLAVYERCLEKASGNGHTFAGFIDADEYLFLRNASDTVDSLLRDFEPYGGLVVNWRMFGSSGLQKHPPEGTLRGFTACAPPGHLQNTHIKSFVNLQHARVGEVHHFRYQHGKYAVNTAYQRVDGPFSSIAVFDRAVLHHYVIRSQEDFETKRKRGLPAGFDDPRGMDFFNSINVYTLDTCLEGHHHHGQHRQRQSSHSALQHPPAEHPPFQAPGASLLFPPKHTCQLVFPLHLASRAFRVTQ